MSDPAPTGVLIRTGVPLAEPLVPTPGGKPKQTRSRALTAWITAAALAPACLTISPTIKGATLSATIEQGSFWLIACSVAVGAALIEFFLGGRDTPRLLLQLAHMGLAFTSFAYFAYLQTVSESGAITTKMPPSVQIGSFVAMLMATIFASVSVLRENPEDSP